LAGLGLRLKSPSNLHIYCCCYCCCYHWLLCATCNCWRLLASLPMCAAFSLSSSSSSSSSSDVALPDHCAVISALCASLQRFPSGGPHPGGLFSIYLFKIVLTIKTMDDTLVYSRQQYTSRCTNASALSPQLPLVRRESGCTGVYRSDSLDTLMQEECAHFRVDGLLSPAQALLHFARTARSLSSTRGSAECIIREGSGRGQIAFQRTH
jgi:hypothetical protein